LIGVHLMKGWLLCQQEIQSAMAGRRLILGLRSALFTKILSLPASFHTRRKSGELLTRVVTDVNQIKELVLGVGLSFAGEVLTVLGMLVVLAAHDPFLALASVLVLPVLFLPTLRFSSSIRTTAREQRKRQGELAGSINETLRSVRAVQAFGRSDLHRKAFDARDLENLKAEVRMKRLQSNLLRLVEAGVAVGSALVVWIGARKVLGGQLSAGDLIVFVSYLRSMYRPLEDLAKLSSRFNKAVASAERIGEILAMESEIRDPEEPVPLSRARGAIELDRVSFGYDAERLVLDGVSLSVDPGECVALLGESGVGKSSLASLVLRFYDPQAGIVRLDGVDIRRYRLDDLRRQIAVVFQEPYLYGVSLRENIAYGRPSATEEEILDAARKAQVHEFAERLPKGYDTVLGEHGATLSAGQRQRVAIARAFLRDAPVLILDEPMTGLDEGKERQVDEALEELKKGRTTILITHRLRDVDSVDRIIRLHRGRVAEVSTSKPMKAESARRLDPGSETHEPATRAGRNL
jgi:ATP-binding cassette subfamily B protein